MSELLVIIALMTKTNMVESRSQSKFKYILYEVTLSWDKKTFFWGMDETKCEKAKKEFYEFAVSTFISWGFMSHGIFS